MASMSISASYTDGFYVYFNDLGYSADAYSYFYVEIYNSSNTKIGATTTYTSSSTSNLFTTRISSTLFQPNTSYYLLGKAKHPSSSIVYDVGSKVYVTTKPLPSPPASPSGFTPYSPNMNTVYASWSRSYDATGYYLYKDNVKQTTLDVATLGYFYNNLTPSTTYYFSISAYNEYGESSRVGKYIKVQDAPKPSTPTGFYATVLSDTSIRINWSSATNATKYIIYKNGIYQSETTSLSYTFTGLSNYTEYTLSVASKNDYGVSETTTGGTYRTLDKIPPTVSINTLTGTVSGITVTFSGSDSGSGVSGYNLYISAKNGSLSSSTKLKGTTYSTSYTFTTDLNDYSLDGGTYTIGVTAFDKSGNYSTTMATKSITIKSTRPSNFNWSTYKNSGGDFNITATEWNNLTNKINEFRKYESLESYTFTIAYKGNDFTALMYNEARNAINAMNPPTTIPNYKSKGDDVLASDINKLVTSLNSIK